MIKASALLVALAIGLLVAGVVASSLLTVYVSIGVCAVAALLLAVGVLSHWSEIFGRSEARPASTQGAWSEPQVQASVASAQAATARAASAHAARAKAASAPAAQTAVAGAPVLAGAQAAGAGRTARRPGREDAVARPGAARTAGGRSSGRRPKDHPVEVVQPLAAEPAMRRGDDLWERVDEEIESAGKRDTGALSWPAIQVPVLRDVPAPPEPAGPPAEAGPRSEPRVGANAWMWGSGSGWQPPQTSDPAWPPPAAAFAGAKATPEAETPEPAGPESAGPEPAAPDADAVQDTDAPPEAEAAPEAAAAPEAEAPRDTEPASDTGPAADAEPVPAAGAFAADDAVADAEDHEAAGPASGTTSAEPAAGEPAADEAAAADGPRWIIAAPPPEPPAARDAAAEPAATEPPPDRPAAEEPAAEEPVAAEPEAEQPEADAPTAQKAAAEDAAAAAEEPDAEEPAAGEPATDGAAAAPVPGRIEVTVVPGVARYHRSGCILIRFLGAGDLEIMTRQEAEDAKFMACRACQPDQLES